MSFFLNEIQDHIKKALGKMNTSFGYLTPYSSLHWTEATEQQPPWETSDFM